MRAGIRDIHITNEIVGRSKMFAVAKLASQITLRVCVDDPCHIAPLAEAASAAGSVVGVFVEPDVGQRRCGVKTAGEAFELIERVCARPSLEFRGVQAYHGGLQHIRRRADRMAATKELIRAPRRRAR